MQCISHESPNGFERLLGDSGKFLETRKLHRIDKVYAFGKSYITQYSTNE